MYLVPEELTCRRRPPEVLFRGVVSGAAPRRFTMAFSQRGAFGGLLRDTFHSLAIEKKILPVLEGGRRRVVQAFKSLHLKGSRQGHR
mmetsp:Transcript_10390/g.25781  ORF Transcript_10390/g.25781 Transcript_10390/m.25781 type:complete len:87 (+) Transcript_10390:108-368(+)